MYENGRQVNRYANKKKHKRKMKRWSGYLNDLDGLPYWKTYYLSGRRGFAKEWTNRRLRSKFREEVAQQDYENMSAPHCGEYRKHFDYAWTIW